MTKLPKLRYSLANQCKYSLPWLLRSSFKSERSKRIPRAAGKSHDHQAHKDWQDTKFDLRKDAAGKSGKSKYISTNEIADRIRNGRKSTCVCHNRFLQFSIKSEEVRKDFSIYSHFYIPKFPLTLLRKFKQAVTV